MSPPPSQRKNLKSLKESHAVNRKPSKEEVYGSPVVIKLNVNNIQPCSRGKEMKTAGNVQVTHIDYGYGDGKPESQYDTM